MINLFKALSDNNRFRIIKMLEIRPLCVCEITAVLNMAVSTVSSHLKILKNSGLISEKKEGKWVIYDLNPTASTDIELLLEFIKTSTGANEYREDQLKAVTVNREKLNCN